MNANIISQYKYKAEHKQLREARNKYHSVEESDIDEYKMYDWLFCDHHS